MTSQHDQDDSLEVGPDASGPDPDFDLSLLGMVADALGLIPLVWELADDVLYLGQQWSRLQGGPLRPMHLNMAQFQACLHPDDRQELGVLVRDCLVGRGAGTQADVRIRLPSGAWRWHTIYIKALRRDASGRATRMVGVLHDAHEKKQQALQIDETETRYRLMFEHSLDPVLLATPEGAILWANQAASKLTGYTQEQLLLLDRARLLDLSDRRIARMLRQRAYTGVSKGPGTLIRQDGRRCEVEISAVPYRDGAGKSKNCILLRELGRNWDNHANT